MSDESAEIAKTRSVRSRHQERSPRKKQILTPKICEIESPKVSVRESPRTASPKGKAVSQKGSPVRQ